MQLVRSDKNVLIFQMKNELMKKKNITGERI